MTNYDDYGINLDGMYPDDLMAFWYRASRGWATARELFPDRPTGYVSATRDLANYASNKATAMRLREAGNIQAAFRYETIADRIYDSLPEFARW